MNPETSGVTSSNGRNLAEPQAIANELRPLMDGTARRKPGRPVEKGSIRHIAGILGVSKSTVWADLQIEQMHPDDKAVIGHLPNATQLRLLAEAKRRNRVAGQDRP